MKRFFTCLFACISLAGVAQNTFNTQVAAANRGSSFTDCTEMPDGTFTAIGSCVANNTNAILLVTMDNVGRVVTSQAVAIANAQGFAARHIIHTSDSGFAILGFASSGGFILKYKADFSPEWAKQITSATNGNFIIYNFIQVKDGSYLVCGSLFNQSQQSQDAALVKISKSGDLVYSKQFLSRKLSKNPYTITSVAETTDGNYAMMAAQGFGSFDSSDSTILGKITPDGTPVWAKALKSSSFGVAGLALLPTADNGIVAAGASLFNFNFGGSLMLSYQMMMAKFKGDGTQQWFKKVSAPSLYTSYATSVVKDKLGNYVFGGLGAALNTAGTNLINFNYFVSLTPDGAPVWNRKMEGSVDYQNLNLSSLRATNDGGYIASGYENSTNENDLPLQVASLYKYGAAFQSCKNGKDSIGTVSDDGSSAAVSLSTGTSSVVLTDIATTATDFGTFIYPCNSVLPVRLLSFTASLAGNNVQVQFATANEVNADHFTVERSGNGASFTAVQNVAAKGNSISTQNYLVQDDNPLPGTSYYRLKQVDKTGAVVYSSMATIVRSGSLSAVVSPNPVQNTIHIVLQSTQADHVALEVSDITGKIVALQSRNIAAGTNTINIPAANLGKGMYFIKITQNNAVQMLRIVKQ